MSLLWNEILWVDVKELAGFEHALVEVGAIVEALVELLAVAI